LATFWQALDLARRLHSIRHLIVLEHRDCGAYALVLGGDLAKKPAAETHIHAEMTGKLAASLRQRHPEISLWRSSWRWTAPSSACLPREGCRASN
jgi:carbonic anhydrase